jgi:DNA-binding transcriptional ArsR family regulator
MSRKSPDRAAADAMKYASVFSALGDGTRLALVAKLSAGGASSIATLTEGSNMTRQAVTRHLQVLESAGIVRSVRSGRESLCEFDPARINEARKYLESVSRQWDQALDRLKSFVED